MSDIDPESFAFTEDSESEQADDLAEPGPGVKMGMGMEVEREFDGKINSESPNYGNEEIRAAETPSYKRVKEEFVKFGESIAVQLSEIPDAYSRSVAKLRINQILFEAEIGAYAKW